MTDRPFRIGVWCAVSSQAQAAEDKSSLQDQEEAGRRFAESVGELVATYRVPGHSRTMWRWEDAERQMPAYRQLREDVEAGRIDVLWCLESSRLGRDAALVQQVVSLLESNGAELYRADSPHELGRRSTAHRFLDSFGAIVAQQENETRRHRHRSGMQARVKRGLFCGLPPYGYVKAGDRYEQDANADAIRMITRLYIEGHSISEIRRRMDASGYKPQKAKYWHNRSIGDIVWNSGYAGYPRWGSARYEGEQPSPHYEPIWDEATFAAVIRERERRNTGRYVRRGGGPLTGVAVCVRCGYRMTRQDNGRGLRYLRCPTHQHRNQHPEGLDCHINFVREDKAIRVLSDYIKRLATDDTIDRVFARIQEQQRADESQQELERLRYQLDQVDAQRERIAHAFAIGDMALAYYRKEDDALEAQQGAARLRVSEIERFLSSLPDLEAKREQLRWLFENFDHLLESADPAVMSKAIQDAGFRLMCEAGECWVDWS